MKSALALLLGISVLGLAAGCDPAATDDTGTGGKIAVGGTASTAGTGGTGGAAMPTDGVLIPFADGWVDVASNALSIQGAIFAYGDDTSKTGMMEDFMGANACIKGTAAEVVDPCTIVPPAVDCYGTFWGAAIGLNLNQPKDPDTGMGVEVALPFDASTLKGFRFTLSGGTVPTTLRFKVEDDATPAKEYCTSKTVGAGTTTVLFSELTAECWKSGGATAETAKGKIVKIAWQTVTKKGATIPFDYCVSDIVALTTGAPPTGPVGGGTAGTSGTGTAGTSSGTGTAGTSSGTAGTSSGTAGAATGGTASGGTAAGGAATGGAATAGSGGASGGAGGTGGG
jgi:hypothetical protein